MEELSDSAKLDPPSRKLLVLDLNHRTAPPIEISTVYFRAGYAPVDYVNDRNFEVRDLLERSRAIKCPSIALQLAGSKKVQQVLTQPGVLEKYLCDEERWGMEYTFGLAEVDEVRASWMGMWGLEEDEPDAGASDGTPVPGQLETVGVRRAREASASLVLKPQREGGGNNVYKDAIPKFLDGLAPEEWPGWIAMRLIAAPEGLGNYLVRTADVGTGGGPVVEAVDVVSELGIFGWALFGGAGEESVKEEVAGWLLRTKEKGSDEGGVAAGFSVLDSLVLVDD